MLTLLTCSMRQEPGTGIWWVSAVFATDDGQFAARWPFATRGEAEAFADDEGVVETAGQMARDRLAQPGTEP